MKQIRFDSVGGAAGDMILAAMAGLGADLKLMERGLNDAIPEDEFVMETMPFSDYGMNGMKLDVKITKSSGIERGLEEIGKIIDRTPMPEKAKKLAHGVFHRLAHAEAEVHGCHAHHVHFHEVGAVDSIVDILGSCWAFEMLGADSISFGVLPEGTGTFRCRHGIYPIPAPATLRLLKDIEIKQTDEPFEMITPTGAALLTTLPGGQNKGVSGKIVSSALSFGSRKLNGRPNVLRATLVESAESGAWATEPCIELETNLDDVTPEAAGALSAKLFEGGARDVWMIPAVMKKQRPGYVLHVLCFESDLDRFSELVFRETGTLGVRVNRTERRILERDMVVVNLPCGAEVRVKRAFLDGRTISAKPEYEDCRKVSDEYGIPYREVFLVALNALEK